MHHHHHFIWWPSLIHGSADNVLEIGFNAQTLRENSNGNDYINELRRRKFGNDKAFKFTPNISSVQYDCWKSKTIFKFAFWTIIPFTDLDLFTNQTLNLNTPTSIEWFLRIHYECFQANVVSEKSHSFLILRGNGRIKPKSKSNKIKHIETLDNWQNINPLTKQISP